MAGVFAATLAGFVAIGAGFAAVVLVVLFYVVAFGDLAFAVRAGTFGWFYWWHSANI
jgi:hypothetical protein